MNTEKISALKRSKEVLTDAGFICTALEIVGRKHSKLHSACGSLTAYVMQNLEENSTLTNWLREQLHDELPSHRGWGANGHKALQCRHAWIDKMIYDLENSNDES